MPVQGIYDGFCGSSVNHGVVVVGYTKGALSKYNDAWMVKNSWGRYWGESGYIRMKRNVNSPDGLCGIALYVSPTSK